MFKQLFFKIFLLESILKYYIFYFKKIIFYISYQNKKIKKKSNFANFHLEWNTKRA